MKSRFLGLWASALIFLFGACSINKKISKQANVLLIKDTAIRTGHIGISLFEPSSNTYWYNYNASHYFIPASNTKLFSFYAGLKYLKDSLVAAHFDVMDDSVLVVEAMADPSFLQPAFSYQPLFDLMKKYKRIELHFEPYRSTPQYGYGWAWDDYEETYMPLPSQLPIYGNQLSIKKEGQSLQIQPSYFEKVVTVNDSTSKTGFQARRAFNSNTFWTYAGKNKVQEIPFIADINTVVNLLQDTLHTKVEWKALNIWDGKYKNCYSQPTDTLLKGMMHRSDNFYAEQVLMMASKLQLGSINAENMRKYLLENSLKDIPQKPSWVDGSGLSRYNLFTPMSIVYLLNKMKQEFSWDRITTILPTGGEGTIRNYYLKDSGYIFAKTGTLSNNCALSGYLITKKGKLLIFSILANNYIGPAGPVRRAVEHFLEEIRTKY